MSAHNLYVDVPSLHRGVCELRRDGWDNDLSTDINKLEVIVIVERHSGSLQARR